MDRSDEDVPSRRVRTSHSAREEAVVPISETLEMISTMAPLLHSRTYVYAKLSSNASSEDLAEVLPYIHSMFQEEEGISLLLPIGVYDKHKDIFPKISSPLSHIELQIFSSLEGVGLTAAVSSALAAAQIPCNMVAAFNHDHIFVPEEDAENALEILEAVAREAKANVRRSKAHRETHSEHR